MDDVVQDHRVTRLVAGERGVEILDHDLVAGPRRAEGGLADDEAMLERAGRSLGLRVDLEAHGPELHFGDRVMAVAPLRGRR
jgi:hypothetical protein